MIKFFQGDVVIEKCMRAIKENFDVKFGLQKNLFIVVMHLAAQLVYRHAT